MKKFLSILLCLTLALGCAMAFAEEEAPAKVNLGTISINGAFMLQCGMPEGYEVQPVKADRDQVIAILSSKDPEKPVLYLSVAFDEAYADVDRMNDLDEEAFELLEKSFTDVDPTVEITYGDTGLGTRLLIAMQNGEEEYNYIDFLSVYKGYFVEFVMVPSMTATSKILTEEQMSRCIDFLTDLDFIPVEGEVLTAGADTYLAALTDYDPETNTVNVELKSPVTVTADEVAGLEAGGTLYFGQEVEKIETMETLEDGEIVINDEIYLRKVDEEYHIYLYEHEFTEVFYESRMEIGENVVFVDGIDPATGEILDDPAEQDAKALIALLTAGGVPDFSSDNVKITLDQNGALEKVERFYTPWQ